MNQLTAEIRRSLKELDLGLKGELTITADMEELSTSLFMGMSKRQTDRHRDRHGGALYFVKETDEETDRRNTCIEELSTSPYMGMSKIQRD